jgi:hypothetical protein
MNWHTEERSYDMGRYHKIRLGGDRCSGVLPRPKAFRKKASRGDLHAIEQSPQRSY